LHQVQGVAVGPGGLEAPGFLNGVDKAREVALAVRGLAGNGAISGAVGMSGQRCCRNNCGTLPGRRFIGLRLVPLRGFVKLPIGTGRATPQGEGIISVGHLSTSLGCAVTVGAVKSPIRRGNVNCFTSAEIIPASKEGSTGDETSHDHCVPTGRAHACPQTPPSNPVGQALALAGLLCRERCSQ
jgi:hypothetical protein